MTPSTQDHARKRELGTFLRTMRARVQPQDVGLPLADRHRRTPGLRREEVAQLAGVGLTWYTWLEQGRDIPASIPVVDALSRAFGLDPDTHAYLRTLAGLPLLEPDGTTSVISSATSRLLRSLEPNPAYVRNARYDILAWNRAMTALYRDLEEVPAARRNALWLIFTDSTFRSLIVYWEDLARMALADFRSSLAEHAGDGPYQQLVDELCEASVEFTAWWDEYPVRSFRPEGQMIEHPVGGRLQVDLWQLQIRGEPGMILFVLTPAGERDVVALERLMSQARADGST
jgi:transcriptional regulator with XRE-family HTH domain